jgi:hypothetical protein
VPLPDDLTTFTLTFGPYIDATGTPVLAGVTGTLKPDRKLVHVATGRQILETPIPVTIDPFGVASVGPLPHCDNDGIGGPFLYKMVWDLPAAAPSPGNLQFSVLESDGNTIDFDLLVPSETVPSVAVPSALSVAGLTGAITDDDLVAALDVPLRAASVAAVQDAITAGDIDVGTGITPGTTAGQIPVWDGAAYAPQTPTPVTAADIGATTPTVAAGIAAGMALVFGG